MFNTVFGQGERWLDPPTPWIRPTAARKPRLAQSLKRAMMSARLMQRLPGFRDFYPEDCAFRNYIFETWRRTARSFGFVEYDGPTVEPIDLYKKKSGDEIKTQLFRFVDQGNRDICLRPEMTPTVARLIAARERDFKKPIKWFSIAPFFRFEKPQKGRVREFYQINCDIIGDDSASADAELIALAVEMNCALGLTQEDFYIRINNRNLWLDFLVCHGQPAERLSEFLAIIDKFEREERTVLETKLATFGFLTTDIETFIRTPASDLPGFENLFQELQWRGLLPFVHLDLTIVRGLDYYTGLVFEVFDRKRENRAIAGGGRYDNLIRTISDGAADLPAVGFAVGDLVLSNFLQELEHTRQQAAKAIKQQQLDLYVTIADESKRPEAIQLVSHLRRSGVFADYPLHPAKLGKQLQHAESLGAEYAAIVGQEWPQLKLKRLADRTEQSLHFNEIASFLRQTGISHVSNPSL
jgi:histidyl-tRNA synthetase